MNFAALLKDPDILQYFDRICRKTFVNDADADECYLYILNKMEEDDYRRLRKYDGRAKLKTWLYSVASNLKSDFIRKKMGRRHIPTAVTKIGDWAVAVYKLLCWQRQEIEEAWVVIVGRGLYSKTLADYLEDVEAVLRYPCPEEISTVSLDVKGDAPASPEANPFNVLLTPIPASGNNEA